MKNKANFGSRSIGAGFGNPPTNSTASIGDGKCYKLKRAYELVLTRNPTVGLIDLAGGLRCNWNIHWASNSDIEEIPIGGMGPVTVDGVLGDPPHCSELNCPTTVTETGPTITVTNLGGGLTNHPLGPPVPDFADLCAGPLGNSADPEFRIKWKYKKIVTGCSEVIRSHIWPHSVNVGSLWSVANDLFCAPQVIPGTDPHDLEGDAEETWKKILACLCKIANETDPAKKEKMQDNLAKNLTGCAEKWNKNASVADQKRALGFPARLVYFGGTVSDEHIEDLTSIKYQECLSEIDDFCAE